MVFFFFGDFLALWAVRFLAVIAAKSYNYGFSEACRK